MNTLFLTGIAIFLGIISGKVFERFRIPQVVGYILLGLLLGKSFLHVFEGEIAHSLAPLVNLTLGIIGAVIGGELKGEVFRKFGRTIYTMLCAEGLMAFFLVAVAVTVLTGKLYLGLILGAIASATDPASTVSVLWEYKAKGPLTRTLTSIIALDDALALIIYGLVSVFSSALILDQTFSLWEGLGQPLLEIIECLLLGAASAAVVIKICERLKEENLVVALILGVITAGVGLSTYLDLDIILSSMAFGATMANLRPKVSEKLFTTIKEMTTSLYILFFVAVGAKMDIHQLFKPSLLGLVTAYLLARSAGKIFGASAGGWLTHAPPTVTRYTGICLFTQGGVAMGLALSISHNLAQAGPQGQEAGMIIINTVVATTFIVQLIGPPLVKWGITRADERGRNVTREDIIDGLRIHDVMQTTFQAIPENAHLNEVLEIVRNHDDFNYPVVDAQGRLHGIITIKELKDALLEQGLDDNIILAEDIAVPAPFLLLPQQHLADALDLFRNRNLPFLPVIESRQNPRVVGIIEPDAVNREIEKRLLEQHREGGDS